ncbi:MAG: bifunctional metallophosphatase/5'-nucleotidase [Prevotella sp.]|nr:bifunctional metallophosphatase/5'-nucleotidase [Prevotella sp.]
MGTVSIRVIGTSDIHGCFFPWDFISNKPVNGSLTHVMTYVRKLREVYKGNLLLLDNGDILQGQPTCYYSNFINTDVPNLAAEISSYMGYDAHVIGNHDIETGHIVYDRFSSELSSPLLGANVICTTTNEPYFKPYTMINRDGVRIAILGMLTPAIPYWLHESLWEGFHFSDIVESTKMWISHLREKEQADVIIGLFHSGLKDGISTDCYKENSVLDVAESISGIDLIIYGHDHHAYCQEIRCKDGSTTLCLNPSSCAYMVADAEIKVKRDGERKEVIVVGKLTNMEHLTPDSMMISHFSSQIDDIKNYTERVIGRITHPIRSIDCFFGSAAFSDLIHDIQLDYTGAQISFNAPLTFDTIIPAGEIRISDMFGLYRYENQLYVLSLTGEEIIKFLEMSYDMWICTMQSADDHIMRMRRTETGIWIFSNLAFNFDTAVGIDYTVDVSKPPGKRICVKRMSNGECFCAKKRYTVAMNSYRGNGGGEMLTNGAGITLKELRKRIVSVSEIDQRLIITNYIERAGTICPKAHNNWRFIPEEWTTVAIERDRKMLDESFC